MYQPVRCRYLSLRKSMRNETPSERGQLAVVLAVVASLVVMDAIR